MRFPEPLRKGDLIGVCAPSSGVRAHLHALLDRAIANLRALGYRVIETDSVRQSEKCVSADAATRAREFMSLYEHPEVRLILPPWGGEFLMDMLPRLDIQRLKSLPPKWVCGYSDISTLCFFLTACCDVATVHGSNLMNMGFQRIDPADLAAFSVMGARESSQRGFERFGRFRSFEDIDGPAYVLDRPGEWALLSGAPSASFEGMMIGGCLDVLTNLVGTRFAPVSEFLARYPNGNFIWTLESCEMSAADIYRTLWQMLECGWFERSAGFVIGRPDGYSDTRDFTLRDALESALSPLNVPVITGADIGHIPPQIQIVNGAQGRVSIANGAATIEQRLV